MKSYRKRRHAKTLKRRLTTIQKRKKKNARIRGISRPPRRNKNEDSKEKSAGEIRIHSDINCAPNKLKIKQTQNTRERANPKRNPYSRKRGENPTTVAQGLSHYKEEGEEVEGGGTNKTMLSRHHDDQSLPKVKRKREERSECRRKKSRYKSRA